MIDELSGLRLDWALSRDGEGWRVSRIYDDVDAGEVISYITSGASPAEAIANAITVIEREAREEAERRADYERRKVAGQLTEFEQRMEQMSAIWAPRILEAVTTNSILADRFERILENTQAEGDTIQIPKYDRLLG